VILALILSTVLAQQPRVVREVPVEVFQVLDLPVAVIEPVLVNTKNGYLLKCVLSNKSEFSQHGLRYKLSVVDSMNVVTAVISKSEGLRLEPFQTKTITFVSPVKLNLKAGERIVLMLEQTLSAKYIWDVLEAEESLRAYVAGDYSTIPRVLRVINQVDAPVRPRVVY
jgi:hypothetical protein